MQLIRCIRHLSELVKGSVATVGNFDGVHGGHQSLLHRLKQVAKAKQLPMLVILFEPQPAEFFNGAKAPARLTSLREKITALASCGVDIVYCITFNRKLASMTAEAFAEQYLFCAAKASYLLIGEDFRFGQDRTGNVALLTQLGADNACVVESFANYYLAGERVSSTAIRHALQQGNLALAARLLGRNYAICGRVIRGAGLASQWGVPTANIKLSRLNVALRGVFCVSAKLSNRRVLTGVANLGYRPTVDGNKWVLEVHLFDFNDRVYGELLQVEFLHKLRDEVKFNSLEMLFKQIREDIKQARGYFNLKNGECSSNVVK